MTSYSRIVGLIGAPKVTITVRASEVDILRAMVDQVPPTVHATQRDAAEAVLRELDARIGALGSLGVPDTVPAVPLEPDEHAALREAFETLRGLRSGSHGSATGRLMSLLDQRVGAAQALGAAPAKAPLQALTKGGTNR